ncbi:MAG: hypothetical protein ACRCW4_00455 [Candidatus Neomicrothrix subdominans]
MTTVLWVELTDEQVAYVRGLAPTPDTVLAALQAALPPEPVQLTIELPGDTDADDFEHVYERDGRLDLRAAEAAALNAVGAALRKRGATQ